MLDADYLAHQALLAAAAARMAALTLDLQQARRELERVRVELSQLPSYEPEAVDDEIERKRHRANKYAHLVQSHPAGPEREKAQRILAQLSHSIDRMRSNPTASKANGIPREERLRNRERELVARIAELESEQRELHDRQRIEDAKQLEREAEQRLRNQFEYEEGLERENRYRQWLKRRGA